MPHHKNNHSWEIMDDVGSVVGLLLVGEACDVILVVGVVVGSCVGILCCDVSYVVGNGCVASSNNIIIDLLSV